MIDKNLSNLISLAFSSIDVVDILHLFNNYCLGFLNADTITALGFSMQQNCIKILLTIQHFQEIFLKSKLTKEKEKITPSGRNSQNKFMKNDTHTSSTLKTLYKHLCLKQEVTQKKNNMNTYKNQ